MSKTPVFKTFVMDEDGSTVVFTLNRPEVRNAMNPDSYLDILHFIEYYEQAEHLRAAIFTGAGDRAFISGADLRNVKVQSGLNSLLHGKLRVALARMENCTKPLIAAINGYAFGGGFELALACDIRLVCDRTVLGLPETMLGVIPGAGGTQRLSRIAGLGIAKDMILGGRTLSHLEAVQYGIAMKTVPPEALMSEAKALAKQMARRGPLALTLGKKLIHASLYTDPATGYAMESLAMAVALETEDKLEGTAAFLEKRAPVFQGK